MTDGAAMISRDLQRDYPVLQNAHDHLTSRDPEQFWTSGQWMTEKEGGSDVGAATDTHALPIDESSYELFGYKWFTSAITSDMTLTLARIHDEDGNIIPGSRGLSMFYLELRDENGELNNIQVHKLKNKLGTRQLPTAELNLNGTVAQRIGNPGQGIKLISGYIKFYGVLALVRPYSSVVVLLATIASTCNAATLLTALIYMLYFRHANNNPYPQCHCCLQFYASCESAGTRLCKTKNRFWCKS